MARRPSRYRWEWELEAAPAELWPLVADTNRFNRDTGAPEVRLDPGAGPVRNGRLPLRLRVLGREVPYEEEPFEWVRPERFGVARRYRSGPLAELRVRLELASRRGGGSRLVYEVAATPRGLAGRLLVAVAIGRSARRRMDETFRRYDRIALARPAPGPREGRARIPPGGRVRLARARADLARDGAPPALVDRLAGEVERGDELSVARMRPYALADEWGADRRSVLELFLLATRAGLLELRWEVLCPLCRGPKEATRTLAGLVRGVHCDACNIDFDASLERSVELTFRPSPSVREVAVHEYCVGGPQVTPHVVVQQLLEPGETRMIEAVLEPGRYRVRSLGLAGAGHLEVSPPGAPEVTIPISGGGWPEGEAAVAPAARLSLSNETEEERLVLLERTAWSDQAATAAEVTALQAFRDLFSAEALRPGEEMSVGAMTIVFTDLRDSTRLYREIGDAPAYGSVVEHFDVVAEAVRREGGAVVKTIGDAVMAVFRRPAASLDALLAAQAELASPAGGRGALRLKVGMHSGPCIAVRLNGRLDYFGSTVNAAARLTGLSTGHDVVISDAVRTDPEVAERLDALAVEPVQAVLKGFDDEPFALWRVSRSG